MSRQDITKSVQAQMMRATDVGHPPLDGIMGQIAEFKRERYERKRRQQTERYRQQKAKAGK